MALNNFFRTSRESWFALDKHGGLLIVQTLPNRVRWALVFPIGLMMLFLVRYSFEYFTQFFHCGEFTNHLFNIISSFVMCFAFVNFGAATAPQRRAGTAIILALLLIVISLGVSGWSFAHVRSIDRTWLISFLIASIAGAVAAAFNVVQAGRWKLEGHDRTLTKFAKIRLCNLSLRRP
ncbi:hypothetical protein [Collimonas arenae]|uniref:hypothetical protein n=1 Tax=Collimonas arenae TaxID=279058 RepID=UPI00056E1BB7|nr:hypothetical protein [Collimonas arenae]